MGILDDAIRQHLELKRQHGAGDDDLERLEKEAFGPATRPGDPDFADPATAGAGTDAPDQVTPAASTAVAPLREPEAGQDRPPTAAEQAPAEHAGLGETADHPAALDPDAEPTGLEQPAPMAEPLPPTEPIAEAGPEPGGAAVAEPPEAPERGIFDAEDIDFGDFDLDFDEEDDGTVSPQPAAPEPSPFEGDDDLSLDFGDEASPTGDAESAPPGSGLARPNPVVDDDTDDQPLPVPPREEEPAPAPPPAGAEQPAEDLLEETPEFLRDTPEGDRAWFEQDPPKDFDFDD